MVWRAGDVGVFGQGDRDPALAEGLLHSLKDRVVEALDLLGGGLTAEEDSSTGVLLYQG